jgi:hypothetical protein
MYFLDHKVKYHIFEVHKVKDKCTLKFINKAKERLSGLDINRQCSIGNRSST